MEKLRAQRLNNDLCNIYQDEIKVLSREMEALQLENQELKHHYETLISAERKEREATLLQLEELQDELHKAEVRNACSSTVEDRLHQLQEEEKRHLAERQKLVTELAEAKQEVKDLCKELQRENGLRVLAEKERTEAVDIADAVIQQLEDMQRVSDELSAELKSEKTVQDQLRYEILDLQQTIQREKDLRNQVETVNLKNFEIEESVCEEFDRQLQKEKILRTAAESNELEAIQIGEALFQRLEEARMLREKLSAESQTLAEKLKEDDEKQKALVRDIVELNQTLDKERVLRVQTETYELETTDIVEALQKRINVLKRRSSARTRTSFCNRRSFSCRFSSRGRRAAR